MRTSIALASALVALCTAAPAARAQTSAQTSEEKLVAAGREEFLQYCASCHGPEGKGNGPLAEDMRVPPADLTHITSRHGGAFPEPMIAEIIDGRRRVRGHGPGNMPVWGRRFDREVGYGQAGDIAIRGRISLLVEYLRSIQAK
jgi:mono/diheme cytochrome c family protein